MMNCCKSSPSLQGTNKFFSKHADRYLKQFRKKGLAKEQKHLVKGIEQSSITGKSILEIGCGIGGLHLTMLQHGASAAVGIDISEGMIEGAKQLSKELDFEDQTQYLLGDIVQMNGTIPEADIVVLDKVVCCYEDIDRLMATSLSKSTHTYALSFPNPNILVKVSFFGLIGLGKLLKWSFHPYWHEWDRVVRRIEEGGFLRTYRDSTLWWTVAVFNKK